MDSLFGGIAFALIALPLLSMTLYLLYWFFHLSDKFSESVSDQTVAIVVLLIVALNLVM